MSTSPLRKNLRLCSSDGIVATPIVYLLQPGNFMIVALLVKLFHLTPAVYGVIASLPFWGNFAQAFLMPVVNRMYSPKAVAIASSTLQALCWATMAVMLSFLPVEQPSLSSPWFLGFFAVSAAVTALNGVSWMSWVQEWVPVRLRGKYFGVRNRLLQVTQIAFLFIAAWIVDRFSSSVIAFQIVLGGAVVMRVVSVFIQRQINAELPVDQRAEARIPWRDQINVLRGSPAFISLVSYGAAWGLQRVFSVHSTRYSCIMNSTLRSVR